MAFDEMITGDESPRQPYEKYFEWYNNQDRTHLIAKSRDAENIFRKTGITFAVYGHARLLRKAHPLRHHPPHHLRRANGASSPRASSSGSSRSTPFSTTSTTSRRSFAPGRIPRELIERNDAFLPEMIGFPPARRRLHPHRRHRYRAHRRGRVLRAGGQRPHALRRQLHAGKPRNDDADVPGTVPRESRSGRSRTIPTCCARALASLAPPGCKGKPRVAVLTPGIYNSAYYEHSFLADTMGVELVEGSDLRVIDGKVKMRTTRGYQAIDVLYRRVDDDFLDPLTFRAGFARSASRGSWMSTAPATSPSPTRPAPAYPTTRRSIPTCPRSSSSTPARKPLLENVPTWRCSEPQSLNYVLEHLEELVVKEVHGSGGYGMLVGPTASKKERADFRREAEGQARQLHRPADAVAFDRADPRQQGHCAAPRGSAPLCSRLRQGADHSRRPDPRGAQAGLAGGQLQPGRRHQRYLGIGGLMLGRTANGLYWMFRYFERAENIARLIDAGLRMSLTSAAEPVTTIGTACCKAPASARPTTRAISKLTSADAIDYLLRDRTNPSSVMSCVDYGRNNARMVRTALTRETWEATNEFWIELKALLSKRLKPAELPEAIDAIKHRAGLIRGAFHGSMLQQRALQLRPHRHLHRARRQHRAAFST